MTLFSDLSRTRNYATSRGASRCPRKIDSRAVQLGGGRTATHAYTRERVLFSSKLNLSTGMRGFVPRTGFRFDVRATRQNTGNQAPTSARSPDYQACLRAPLFLSVSLSLPAPCPFFPCRFVLHQDHGSRARALVALRISPSKSNEYSMTILPCVVAARLLLRVGRYPCRKRRSRTS